MQVGTCHETCIYMEIDHRSLIQPNLDFPCIGHPPDYIYEASLEGEIIEFICIQGSLLRVRGPKSLNSARSRSRRKKEARGGRRASGRPTQAPSRGRSRSSFDMFFVSSTSTIVLQFQDVSRVTPCFSYDTLIKPWVRSIKFVFRQLASCLCMIYDPCLCNA